MSRYDGLIIPRSYNEYINKTDPVAMSQALQLNGVLSDAVAAGDNKAVKSGAVNTALLSYQLNGFLLPLNHSTYTIQEFMDYLITTYSNILNNGIVLEISTQYSIANTPTITINNSNYSLYGALIRLQILYKSAGQAVLQINLNMDNKIITAIKDGANMRRITIFSGTQIV